ncbi:MAG: KEOPS complex kinase/ATPase Bud32 [Candidatus Thermoplasmatota archaeon]|nr:KEOPS complex kinase/ATPase Bud32 [Candidatus Thermoplasmatota archaeon]
MASGGIPMWKPENVLHEGAEATVTKGSWLGRQAVLKSRRARSYRHPDLDRRLTRQRLAVEARVLSRLSSVGFPSPKLMFLDQRNSSMLLSRIEGRTLYDLLKSEDSSGDELFSLGGLIRRLHEIGISHGDLTTHNVMSTDEGELHLIDFGLSRQSPELEHMGLDLQVLRECLGASHSDIDDAIDRVCEGYLENQALNEDVESAEDVLDRFSKIAGRVRYHG